jgi:polyferredoxin
MMLQAQEGLLSTYRDPLRARGPLTALFAALLVGFYLALYFTEWFTPLAAALGLENKWYLYGALYSLAMIVGGWRYLARHGSSRYNVARIATNVLVQLVLAFSLPLALTKLGQKDYYFSYFWPLKIEYLYPDTLASLPLFVAGWAVLGALVAAPVLTLRYGKRWYCSWICGCGALANTFGDPWRHQSNKSTLAWRVEQVTIHATLVVALATTGVVVAAWALGPSQPGLVALAGEVRGAYGFVVGSMLAGVVGTGLYPVLGSRVWCRFFCPMAALLGLIQKLGRFKIAVKPDMCISCGNCSTYCEMGIDVRMYAQANQSFTRASCVGCGMCAHVCPRGVLRLELTGAASAAPPRHTRLRVLP